MPFSIPVTLTSVKNPADKRHLVVSQSMPTLIGRASKSESKNLQPSPNNALFDCPVISREHAELKATKGLTSTSLDQVTITDKGSMHGTYVNGRKMERFTPFTLLTGDLVQFGTRVTRGPDTHDGVYVTFDKDTAASTPKKGYHYPSDHELSEDEDSDVSDISDEEDEEAESSAKTTPEQPKSQPKSQPGSAQQPIDLTSMPPPPRPHVIDLSDDVRDNIYYSSTYRPQSPILPPPRHYPDTLKYYLVEDDDYEPSQDISQTPSKSTNLKSTDLVQDSIDKDAEVLVPESVPLARLDSAGGDEDSVLNHNTGLTGLLNNAAETASNADDDDAESEIEAAVFNPDEDEDDEDDYDEELDNMSESDCSDLYNDLRDEDYADLNSYSAKKRVSPELTSAIPAKSAPSTQVPSKTPSDWTYSAPVKLATQSYYDPVRASHSATTTYGNSMQPLGPKTASLPMAQPYRPYTYAAPLAPLPPVNAASVNAHTDVSSSSRWDIPPTTTAYNMPYSGFGAAPLSSRPYLYGCGYPNPYPDQQRLDTAQTYSFSQGWNDLPESSALEYFETPTEGNTKQMAVESATKKSMKISEMVEKAAESAKDVINDAEAGIMVYRKKRKADEMEKEEPAIPSAIVAEQASEIRDVVMDDYREHVADDVQEPPAQRRKIERPAATTTGRNIAGGIAKFATAAAVGGAGTVAFLCSPLAERLIEWLA